MVSGYARAAGVMPELKSIVQISIFATYSESA
jgi:hypothetical protein